jgi:hypothetical protein
MAATIHGLCLLAVIPLGIVLMALYCDRPKTFVDGGWAVVRGLGTFAAMFILVPLVGRMNLCGPNPEFQWMLPTMMAAVFAAMARTGNMRGGLAALFFVIAIALGYQYRFVLRHIDDYAGMDEGHPFIRCDKPVSAFMLWHSRFTGIVGLKPAEAASPKK